MPELPEVETVRGDLQAALVGRRVTSVSALGARTFRRPPGPAAVVSRALGRRIEAVDRRGKYLMVRLDGGEVVVLHLRMSGQLLVARPGEATRPHTHAVIGVDGGHDQGGSEVRFVDPRTFGEIFVSRADAATGAVPELCGLGPEPLDPGFDAAALAAVLAGRRGRLKALLVDQRRLAGIGNLYGDEILWAARLRPDRAVDGLRRSEIGRLHESMVTTLSEAVVQRGSSLADEGYLDLYGRLGSYQSSHRVYARAGKPCPRCGRPVTRVRLGGRGTYFCPRCQR